LAVTLGKFVSPESQQRNDIPSHTPECLLFLWNYLRGTAAVKKHFRSRPTDSISFGESRRFQGKNTAIRADVAVKQLLQEENSIKFATAARKATENQRF